MSILNVESKDGLTVITTDDVNAAYDYFAKFQPKLLVITGKNEITIQFN